MTKEGQFEILLDFFKVLGNESRLKILGILANGERSVGELAELLDLKEPTVSHHLARLKSLRLVRMRPEGNVRYYCLNTQELEGMSKQLFDREQIASWVPEAAGEDAYARKVLKDYLEDNKIRQLPTKLKKLQVILRWLVDKFEFDVRYPEREVNEIISRYHPDYASLRREFIATKLMAREKGIYWRLPERQDD